MNNSGYNIGDKVILGNYGENYIISNDLIGFEGTVIAFPQPKYNINLLGDSDVNNYAIAFFEEPTGIHFGDTFPEPNYLLVKKDANSKLLRKSFNLNLKDLV